MSIRWCMWLTICQCHLRVCVYLDVWHVCNSLISFLSCVQTSEASVQGSQRSGKAVLPPHALELYQQQITMAHGESSQEVKQQQQPSGQPGKQQPYIPQADRDREALHSSSPRVRPRTPTTSEKDGTHLLCGKETAVNAL